MLFLLGERGRFRRVVDFPVDADADKALLDHVFQNLDMLALFAANDRREELHAGALRQGEKLIDHLIDRLPGDFPAALGAVRHADARVEQAQIVVDLRHRADGGTRVFARGLLVDGDGGGEAVDVVHVGLFLLPEKHPRVGRQAFHIPPLSLGINGVKRQRAFSAAGQSRDDGQLVARDAHINVLEVVLPRALDENFLLHGIPRFCN